jgi:hypothetical protein
MAGKKTFIVDDFIIKLRGHPAFQTSPWPQRIDDLEAVLRTLFVSDNERAIEMFDEVRGVIERKHLTMENRLALIEEILRTGSIHF